MDATPLAKPARFFIVPGLGNSGPDHWQTWFERLDPTCTRIHQKEWETPDCTDWIETIERALKGEELSTVVLIAHSLGCTTVAHWAARYQHAIRGALLVAPSDVETVQYATFPTRGFQPMPLQPLPFASKVVASANDRWVSSARAKQFALAWGSEFIDLGPAGHINAESGFGEWPAGQALLHEWK